MVKVRHVGGGGQVARVIGWNPPAGARVFEIGSLASLLSRFGRAGIADLELLEFELVIAPTSGSGQHEVDFETVGIDPHRWLHIRPGQVHRWIPDGFEATIIGFPSRGRSPHWRPGPRIIPMSDDALHDVEPLLALMRHDHRTDLGPATALLTRDLAIRWLELDLPDSNDDDPLYTSFRRMLSREVIQERNVAYYARQLNCSTRTLTRACERAGAASPKHLIDQSVLLEAKRLLALPNATITETSERLGFTEPTNFTKFFKRVGGLSPSEWQADRSCTERYLDAAPGSSGCEG